MIEVIREFLELLERDLPEDQRLLALARALDRLAICYHDVPAGVPGNRTDAPDRDYQRLRAAVAQRFPELGHYNEAWPIHADIGAGETTVGDAIDDLSDIAGDLEEVVWRWENISIDDAAWSFRFTYQSHWGRHLHSLRSYLHALMFER